MVQTANKAISKTDLCQKAGFAYVKTISPGASAKVALSLVNWVLTLPFVVNDGSLGGVRTNLLLWRSRDFCCYLLALGL